MCCGERAAWTSPLARINVLAMPLEVRWSLLVVFTFPERREIRSRSRRRWKAFIVQPPVLTIADVAEVKAGHPWQRRNPSLVWNGCNRKHSLRSGLPRRCALVPLPMNRRH